MLIPIDQLDQKQIRAVCGKRLLYLDVLQNELLAFCVCVRICFLFPLVNHLVTSQIYLVTPCGVLTSDRYQ